MRASSLVIMMLALAAARVIAQPQGLKTSTRGTNSNVPPTDTRFSSRLGEGAPPTTPELSIGKRLHARGPFVSIFKTRKVVDVPRRVLHLVNPFAPEERGERFERPADLNPRAWATTVGLHPGGSAFPNATTHEPTMTLVKVAR